MSKLIVSIVYKQMSFVNNIQAVVLKGKQIWIK